MVELLSAFKLEIPDGYSATVYIPVGVVDQKLIVDGRELVRTDRLLPGK